jgi:hypothetical protein
MVKYKKIILACLIFLINKINNHCDKDNPILVNGECKNIYCTEDNYKNGDCIIDNPIIKLQWLNNITDLGGELEKLFIPNEMPNKDIIFITYSNNLIHFYELKISDNSYNEDLIEISFGNVVFLNVVGLRIDNKQYPLICSKKKCILYDKESKNYYEQPFHKFF